MAELLFDKEFSHLPPDTQAALKLALAARLAIRTPSLVDNENFPDSILDNYPAAFDRLSIFLKRITEQPSDKASNIFNKIGFVLAISIPCGAQLLDLRSSVPVRSAILSVPRERSFSSLLRYFRNEGWGIWYRGHTDTEYLDEFNEEGWDRFYYRIAELLLRRKHVRGLVGTSWFYDPQLVQISPRLAYLQQRQLERGAYLMRHSTSERQVEFATKKSETRLRLFQEGKYVPVSYSLIWGRDEILSWAKTL